MVAVESRGVCRAPSCKDEGEKTEQLEGPFSRTCQNITSSLCWLVLGFAGWAGGHPPGQSRPTKPPQFIRQRCDLSTL